jgi:hypothetical protein
MKLKNMRFKNKNNIWGIITSAAKIKYWGPNIINSANVQRCIGEYLPSSYYYDYVDERYLVLNPYNGRLLFYGCSEAVKIATLESRQNGAWLFEAKKYSYV